MLHWWVGGSPPMFVLDAEGGISPLYKRGTLLGMEPFSLGYLQRQLNPKDRVFLFTDGLYELPMANERMFGLRQLGKVFQDTRDKNLVDASQAIIHELDLARGNRPQSDDWTSILIEIPDDESDVN